MTQIPKIKLSSGDLLPKLGLGTWLIGGARTKDPNNDDDNQIKGLRDALDQGFTWLRTAQNYADGYCEELVGGVIQNYDRKRLFLSSAVNQNYALSRDLLIEHAQKSLDRLRTNYFDLFLIGAVNPNVPVQEMADGLLYLLENKLAKNIGVSNYRMEELEFITKYTKGKIVYNEMHYNLIIREPEITGELQFCRDNNIVLSAYRPLQLGQLSRPGIQLLDEIAKKYNKTQPQIALKWLVQKEGVAVLVKSLNHQHIKENLDIFSFELEKEDITKLDHDFPIQIRTSDCCSPQKPKLTT